MFVVLAILLGLYGADMKEMAQKTKLQSLSPLMGSSSYQVNLQNETTGNNLLYFPHIGQSEGINIAANNFSMTLSGYKAAKEMYYEGDKLYDRQESSFFDFQSNAFIGNLMISTFYQNYSGFYLESDEQKNSKTNDASISYINTNNQYSLNSLNYGINIHYFFDTKAAVTLNPSIYEKPTNTSFIMGLGYTRNLLSSKSGLVPNSFSDEFSRFYGIREMDIQTLNLDFGHTGIYNFKGFYAGYLFAYSMTNDFIEFTNGTTSNISQGASGFTTRVDLGYQFKSSNLGLSVNIESRTTAFNDQLMYRSRTLTEFYYRYFF
jgi:hypothetical protein